jgi:hypothetical protein
MPGATTNNALPYPVASDNNNVPADMLALANRLEVVFSTKAVGFCNHGATASTARPLGFGMIIWYGSVQPTNMVAPDICIRTDLAV